MTSQRARHSIFRIGIIAKAGLPSIEAVSVGKAEANLKLGLLGIQVKIMSGTYQMPNEIILKDEAKVRRQSGIKPEEIAKVEAEVAGNPVEIIEEIVKPEEEGLFDDNADAQEATIRNELDEIEDLLDKEDEASKEEKEE